VGCYGPDGRPLFANLSPFMTPQLKHYQLTSLLPNIIAINLQVKRFRHRRAPEEACAANAFLILSAP
jgi:hypothetical protein